MSPDRPVRRRIALYVAACIGAVLAVPTPSPAQDAYPSRRVTIVVGGTPGSVGDIASRAVAKKLSEQMGQPVVVENKPGGQGLVSMKEVAAAKPDGYTLVVGSASSTVVAPAIRQSWPIDLLNDFTPVSLIANSVLVILTAKDSPINSIADLVAAARKNPGQVTYGNAANLYQLTMELLGLMANVSIREVPYKGTVMAQSDLAGGLITALPDSLGSATSALRSGRVKPLAVMSAQRTSLLPEAPTMLELGYKDFVFGGTISLLAPAGTPKPIVDRLSAEVRKAMQSEELRNAYAGALLEPVSSTPEELAAMQRRELAVFRRIVEEAKIAKQ